MAVFSFVLDDLFPMSKVCVATVLNLSNNLWSMLLVLLMRVRLSLTNWGQWGRECSVDSTLWLHVHIGLIVSKKLCFNLCSHK